MITAIGESSRSVVSGIGSAVAGVIGTAVGAGIGIRYLIKTGLTFATVLGLLLLVTGLALIVFAVTIAWRTWHRWQRLWLLPLSLLGLVLMWSTALAVMFAYAPRNALGSITPADRGLTYQDVTFTTSDRVQLSAWYVRPTNGAAVVLLPGAGSTRTAVLGHAVALVRHGYGALLVDPRGQGHSGGHAMDIGWYGDRDVPAAVAFLRHQPGIDPSRVAVLGLSMGGEEAIGAAAADPSIRAVVAEGATTRTAADKAGWLPGGLPGAITRGIDRLTYGIADLLSPAQSPTPLHDAIARAHNTPFLLITAGTVADETRAATYFRTAAPDRVEVWNVPGAAHTGGLASRPQEWSARVITFLERALGAGAQ
jgi:dienelactone hydrolase